MTGLQPSAVRAGIMAGIYWFAPLIGRKSDIYTTLAASAILILAWTPADLTNIGFILSYIAVLGLVLLCPVFMAPLHRCFRHDPLKLEADPPWQDNLRGVWLMFADMFSVSLAAWLVTAPLTMLFFGNFALIGLPANLLVVPLSSLVIITGVLSLTLGSCFLFLADLFNHANLALILLMTESTRWFATIHHGYLKVDPPPLWLILVFYAGLLTGRFAVWVYAREGTTTPEGDE
jgi:competence protein ComEC